MGSLERVPIRSAPLDRFSHRDAVVGVCLVDVDSPDWCDPLRPAGLSDDEKRRAEAFRFELHRRRFIEEAHLGGVRARMGVDHG